VLGADEQPDELLVTVRYCGREALKRRIDGQRGCRLCYDELDVAEQLDHFLPNDFGQMVCLKLF